MELSVKSRSTGIYLNISLAGVKKLPVDWLASYDGEVSSGVFKEFERRYGYLDYVVLERHGDNAPLQGKTLAWRGNSLGVNRQLGRITPGATGQVMNANGEILFEGIVRISHDFIAPDPVKAVLSPDGRVVATLARAGYPSANVMLLKDSRGGHLTQWQAGSRHGDTYLDANWQNKALLSIEGRPEDQLVYQLHRKGPSITEVLGPEQMREDTASLGLVLAKFVDPRCVAVRIERDTLYYTMRMSLEDGEVVDRAFKGRLAMNPKGYVQLVERRFSSRIAAIAR